jgi:hypothetical protein
MVVGIVHIKRKHMRITNFQTDKKIYITTGSIAGGDGTLTNPYIAVNGDIDPLKTYFGTSCEIFLSNGTFFTSGIHAPTRFILNGKGIDSTVLKLKDNTVYQNKYFPHIRVISDNYWCELFVVKNLTIDCNWQKQPFATDVKTNNYKIEAITVRVIQGLVNKVRVTNFGCNAKGYGQTGLEAFPIGLTTFTNGTPYKYYSQYLYLKDKEPITYTEISECIVDNGFFIGGGYCTAIFIRSNMPNEGDRQPFGTRDTLAGVVENNYVNVPGGIAYGAAISEQILFKNNIAYDCHAGFNFDTGESQNIEITKNQFLDVHVGINFTPSPNSKNIKITNNVITLTECFYNKVLNDIQPSVGIKISNIIPTTQVVSKNYIKIVGAKENKPTPLLGADINDNIL